MSNKQTTYKPKHSEIEYKNIFFCKCEKPIYRTHNYCPNCGVKLDWGK